ncbi:MAG: hypothetical protein M1296_02390 [Chloroflexi bacterium]|nr:hypothetical protein [Chloroflexota bacterium]
MFVFGIILGALITFFIVRSARRDLVNHVFTISLAIAVAVALLALLTGHGLLGLAAAALLAIGEGAGIAGSTLIGNRLQHRTDA